MGQNLGRSEVIGGKEVTVVKQIGEGEAPHWLIHVAHVRASLACMAVASYARVRALSESIVHGCVGYLYPLTCGVLFVLSVL